MEKTSVVKTPNKENVKVSVKKTIEKPKITKQKKEKQIGKEKKSVAFNLNYKNLPLVRSGNIIYYGSPKERYVLKLTVLESKKENDLDIATKVSAEILNSSNHDICKKSTIKNNLYLALDIGQIWLKKILENETF